MSLRQSNTYFWLVSDLLGQGATGNVFLCRSKNDGKPYAAKVFNHMGQMRASEIRIRETSLLRKLRHENVVTLIAEEQEMATKSTVLIMELCDTSLYHILELPENYYGLSETEFKCVLLDVARGMNYLREHNVVHRDVKPGNILRMRSSTGGSIYKLTDFGAAKQLKDADQSFMSIYGTEEYLHPDVYEKAVMKNYSKKKKFTAAVDLWSMGVTFYHAATGQLPFRPYGGRQNKETMFEIISQKGPKVISGIQKQSDGRIEYSDDLPEETRVSKGLKNLLRPILQELLETTGEGLENLITFDQFHKQVEDIASRKVIDVFCMASSSIHKIYVKQDENFEDVKLKIATQTGINTEDQLIFHSLEEFKPSINSTVKDFPEVSQQSPLILIGGETIPHTQLYQRKIINPPEMLFGKKTRPDNDLEILKAYASVCFVYQFIAEDLFVCSVATHVAFNTIRAVLNRKLKNSRRYFKQLERLKKCLEQVLFRANKELNDIKASRDMRLNGIENSNLHHNATADNQVTGLHQLQNLLENTQPNLALGNINIPENHSIQSIEKCLNEIKTHVNDVNDIYLRISKDKFCATGNLEDLIHTAKKQQISDCTNTIKERFNSLLAMRRDFHIKFQNWFRSTGNKLNDMSKIEYALEGADSQNFEAIAFQALDQISAEKMMILQDRYEKPASGLSMIEAEVCSLEQIAQDILVLVEEGDQKLMSSKEIFEELSTCES